MGMCFGVRDAIELANQESVKEPITVLGELVHNPVVLDDLRAKGVRIENDLSVVATPTVMITAHGTSERTLQQVRSRGHRVLEATCPLVHHAHNSLRKLVDAGYFPVVIGKRDHVEVRGMTDDLNEFAVVLTEQDIDQLPERSRFGVVSQTTQPIEKVRHLVALIKKRFPQAEVRFADTVCQPTKQRQSAAIALARQSDLVIVVGGANSNNTRELAGTCRKFCPRVYHVQTADDLNPFWFVDVHTVGITAGTSTPDVLIDGVESRLNQFAIERAKAKQDACAAHI
jgi:4-hydroxy-3-methylbut-2-enyl diphosphate reductase